MFWDKWIPVKFLIKSEICAVEICHADSGTVYYYTHLKNRNNALALSAQGSSQDNLTLPAVIIKNKVPVVLIINGKGVIVKRVSLAGEADQNLEELIRRNLPTINTDDFYVQVYRQNTTQAFITLCRKEQVDRDVQELRDKKCELTGVLTGMPAITGLAPLWSNYSFVPGNLYVAELSDNRLDTIGPSEQKQYEPLNIEGLVIPPEHTLGFAAGLDYLMQQGICENSSPALSAIETQHVEKNKLRLVMSVVVAIAFLLAVVNVGFYTSYFDKNNKLETELSVYQGKYEQINELLNDYQKNKDLIESAGVLNKNKLSEYGDKIGKTIPDEIVLSELYFNPKKSDEESEDSLVTFQNEHLILKGNCPKSFIVNEWINVLKMQKFIKDVNLEKFSYNSEGILPNFEIRLITE